MGPKGRRGLSSAVVESFFDGPVPESRRAGSPTWLLGAGGRLEPRRAGDWFAPGPAARGYVVAVTAGPADAAPGGRSMQHAAGA